MPTMDMPQAARRKKKSRGAGVKVLVLMLVLVALATVGFAAYRGYLGQLPEMDCAGCAAVSASDQAEPTTTSGSDEAATTTASSTDAVTTSSTQAATTATTVNQQKLAADEIRSMLLSRKWKTTLEGYNATIKFKKDGTATITVEIPLLFFSTTKDISATYSVNDECHAAIIAEYDGTDYGITGYISKISDTELLVKRDKNMGKITLLAA